MKNIFAFLLGIIFLVLATVFFVFLNIKSSFLDPSKMKNLFAETNANNIVSSYVQESISKAYNIDFEEGNNLEVFNSAFDKQSVNNFIGATVDKFFVAYRDPSDQNLVFDVKYEVKGDKLPVQMVFAKKVNLMNNQIFFAMIALNKLLLYIGIAAALALIGLFALGGKGTSGHFLWTSIYLLILGVFLGAILFAAYKIAPNYYSNIIDKTNFVRDVKLVSGMKKILVSFITDQFYLYYIEIAGLLVLGIVSSYFGKLFSRESIDVLDDEKGDPRGYFPVPKKK